MKYFRNLVIFLNHILTNSITSYYKYSIQLIYSLLLWHKMHYIVVIELESVGFTSCKIQALPSKEVTSLDNLVKSLNLPSNKQNESFYEVDTPAIRMINILADAAYGYRVCSQSMVIEKSTIGSRDIQIQKTIWTMFAGV